MHINGVELREDWSAIELVLYGMLWYREFVSPLPDRL